MKHLLTLLCAVAFLTGSAQYSVETTDYQGTVPLVGFTDHNVYVLNELTTDSLHLGWKFIDNTCPPEWTFALCDFGFCYEDIPPSGVMQPIPAVADGFLKLTVWANEVDGSGSVTFWVYEVDDFENYQRITFWFNMAPVSVAEVDRTALTAFPNPASTTLTASSPVPGEWQLFNNQGQLLLDASGIAVSWKIDVSQLPAGWYTLKCTREDGVHTKPVLIQH
ncbi:MAG: T9SS type A sorting domain-containing protein [Flavobacteriales bacterium]